MFTKSKLLNDLIASLEIDLNSNVSSNIFKNTSSAVIQLPSTGPEGRLAFSLNIDATKIDIDQTFYGNDFSELVTTINSSTADTGLSASLLGDNQIFLEGDVSNLFINKFQHFGNDGKGWLWSQSGLWPFCL